MTPGRLLNMEIWIGIFFVSLKCPVIVCMHPKRCIRSKTWMARAHARISAACFMLMMKNLHARLYALKNCEILHEKRCVLSIKQKKAIIAWKWCDILEFKAYDYWVLFLQQQLHVKQCTCSSITTTLSIRSWWCSGQHTR